MKSKNLLFVSLPLFWFIFLTTTYWPRKISEFLGPSNFRVEVFTRPNYGNPLFYISLGALGTYNNAYVYATLSNAERKIGSVTLSEGGDLPEDHDHPIIKWSPEGVFLYDERSGTESFIPFNSDD